MTIEGGSNTPTGSKSHGPARKPTTYVERLQELQPQRRRLSTDFYERVSELSEWVQKTEAEAFEVKQKIRSYVNPKDVPAECLTQLKDLLSESKPRKGAISDVIKQGKGYLSLHNNEDAQLDFDLSTLESRWLQLKRVLRDLANDAKSFDGFRSEVTLSYSTRSHHHRGSASPISSPIKQRIPLGTPEKVIHLKSSGSDPNQSLLKQKGRKYFAKLSIPYRVHIKSKVKLRYRNRSGASEDTSFTDSDLSTITECSSLDSSIRSFTPRGDKSSVADNIREVIKRLPKDEESFSDIEGRLTSSTPCHFNHEDNDNVSESALLEVEESVSNLSQATKEVNNMNSTEIINQTTETMQSAAKSGHTTPQRASPRQFRAGTRASPVNIEEESPRSSKRRRLTFNSDDDAGSIGSLSPASSVSNLSATSSRGGESPLLCALDEDAAISDLVLTPDAVKPNRPVSFSASPFDPGESKAFPKPEVLRRDVGPLATPLLGAAMTTSVGSSSALTTEDDIRFHGNLSFDSLNSSTISSAVSTPTDSPYPLGLRQRQGSATPPTDFRKKYKKDELWAAIASDYQYLMGDDIIETCKSTESESDEAGPPGQNTQVSFNEFLQQYKELTDWLNTIRTATQRTAHSLSEKYLNQKYHEEMLAGSPRRRLFNGYARQLQRRYPSLRDEVQARLQRLNGLWEALEKAICPAQGPLDEAGMIKDLSEDLKALKVWLEGVEGKLSCLSLHPTWTKNIINEKIHEHKVLQAEIESQSKVVSAIIKLCERLECKDDAQFQPESEKESLQLLAISLERRWHAIWLQSLEWQCRLEEGLTREQGLFKVRLADDLPLENNNLNTNTTSTAIATQTDTATQNTTTTNTYTSAGTSDTDFNETDLNASYDTEGDTSEDFYKDEGVHVTSSTSDDVDVSSDATGNVGGGYGTYDESDCCGDVIPFSEGEYEKIPLDEEEEEGEGGEGKGVNGEDSPDSGVGVSKVMAMKSALQLPKTKKRDHDIGYSSESHSDDHDVTRRSRKGYGKVNTAFGNKGLPTTTAPNVQASPSAKHRSVAAAQKSQWRNSMTSAYDTASNGSDPNLLDNTAAPLLDSPTEPQDSGFASANCGATSDEHSAAAMSRSQSANANFYYMTTIEADSSSSVDPLSSQSNPYDRCESGNTSDMDSELLDDDLQHGFSAIPEEGESVASSRKRLFQDGVEAHGDGERGLDLLDLDESERDYLSSAASDILKFMQERTNRGDSLSVQLDSDSNSRAAGLSEDELAAAADQLSNEFESPVPRESVLKLVKQAELLVREGELNKLTNHQWPKYDEQSDENTKATQKRKAAARVNDSFTSTDGSGNRSKGSNRRTSSCDASAESEVSSVSSSMQDLSQSQLDIIRDMLSQHATTRRPQSVTEIRPDLGNSSGGYDISMSPYSISESAIDHRDRARPDLDLRRTASERSQPITRSNRPDSPRKQRRRKLRHSASEESRTSPLKRVSPGSSRGKITSSTPGVRSKARRSASPVMSPVGRPQMLRAGSGGRRAMDYSDSDMEIQTLTAGISHSQTLAEGQTEHAWDHFQMPPQDCISGESLDEKLSDSLLSSAWDVNSITSGELPAATSERRLPRLGRGRSGRMLDSDSDLEDFSYVLEESYKALNFTEHALSRQRKDPMETGINLDPSYYNESLATCKTNIKCLLEILDTLQSESINDVTEDNIQEVFGIVENWRRMESLAYERLAQSRQLSSVYGDMVTLQSALEELDTVLDKQHFDCATDLEAVVLDLQQRRGDFSIQRKSLSTIGRTIQHLDDEHDDIRLNKFITEVDNIELYMDQLDLRSKERMGDLQAALLSWHEMQSKATDAETRLEDEQAHMRKLELVSRLSAPGVKQLEEAKTELLTREQELKSLAADLQLLRALHTDFAPFCARATDLDMRTQLGLMDTQLSDLKALHIAVLRAFQGMRDVVGKEQEVEKMQVETVASRPSTTTASAATQRSLLSRLLRMAIPLSLVIVALLVLAYLVDPSMFDLGIVIAPELRYVNGPPPT